MVDFVVKIDNNITINDQHFIENLVFLATRPKYVSEKSKKMKKKFCQQKFYKFFSSKTDQNSIFGK